MPNGLPPWAPTHPLPAHSPPYPHPMAPIPTTGPPAHRRLQPLRPENLRQHQPLEPTQLPLDPCRQLVSLRPHPRPPHRRILQVRIPNQRRQRRSKRRMRRSLLLPHPRRPPCGGGAFAARRCTTVAAWCCRCCSPDEELPFVGREGLGVQGSGDVHQGGQLVAVEKGAADVCVKKVHQAVGQEGDSGGHVAVISACAAACGQRRAEGAVVRRLGCCADGACS